MMPGSAFAGLALCAAISALHCRAASFEHDAGRPRTLGLPGWHVKPLLPSRRTTLLPCASAPTIRGVGNVPWTRSYRPRHLDFCRLARSTAALICVHVTVIVRLLHLRSDRTSLAQQQAG